MAIGDFDAAALYAALDSARAERGMTWKQVAAEADISASTLTRMAQGKRPDVDSLAALLSWSGLEADLFVRRPNSAPADPLARVTAYLRADAQLSPRAANAIETVLRTTYDLFRDEDETSVWGLQVTGPIDVKAVAEGGRR